MKRLAALLFLVVLAGCAGKSDPTGIDQSRARYAEATGCTVTTPHVWGWYRMVVVWPRNTTDKQMQADMDRWADVIEKCGKTAAEGAPNGATEGGTPQ